jgi:uncharacterized protein (TIGR02217 family)
MGGFHNVRFPDDISYGSSGGPKFMTDIVTMENGAEHTVGYGVRTMEQLSEIKKFWNARKGSAWAFRYKDWLDYTSTSIGNDVSNITDEDQVLGTGDGINTQFQLVKRYTSGSSTQARPITKPVTGTVVIALDQVSQVSGWSIDTLTGIVTFSIPPAEGIEITSGFQFDVPTRFSNTDDEQLNISIKELGFGDLELELVEDFEDTDFTDEFYYGGGNEDDITGSSPMTSDITLSEALGRMISLDPDGATYNVNCPATDKFSITGGPFWYVYHRGSSGTINIRAGGNIIRTLTTSSNNTTLVLAKNNNEYTWITIG